jgi:environmental stress-induced protein Ves
MRVIPCTALPLTRWKNGAGTRREIASLQREDGTTDWSLSLADITADAPFSSFPGLTRWIAVIGEGWIELGIAAANGQRERVLLGGRSNAFVFPGENACTCRLMAPGPVRVLNLMVRGPASRARLDRLSVEGEQPLDHDGAALQAVFVVSGSLHAARAGARAALGPMQCLLLEGLSSDRDAHATLQGRAEILRAVVGG